MTLTVDDVLFALRLKGWRYWWDEPKLWKSYCPVCLFPALTVYDGYEGIKLGCRNRCEELDILAAFSDGLEVTTVDEALTMAESALLTAQRLRDLLPTGVV